MMRCILGFYHFKLKYPTKWLIISKMPLSHYSDRVYIMCKDSKTKG